MTTYISGVLVFKASNGDTGLLWFPASCRQQHCQTGLALYQLGQWLLYDKGKDMIVRPLEGTPPYETRLYRTDTPNRDVFVEINVPLVFFSDKIMNQIVAYAPGFGRVGSFFRQTNLKMDCLYHAWIAFFGLYRDAGLSKLMNTFDVQWLLTSMAEPFSVKEMIQVSASESGLELKLVNGIVINCDNSFEDSSGSDSGNDKSENDDEGKEHHEFKIVRFWTPWLHSICTFRYEETNNSNAKLKKLDFRVGNWFRFMPAANWSNTGVAVNPFAVKTPKGMAVIGRNPLKLRISHTLYNLDQDPAAHIVHVPDWLGVLQCGREFFNSLLCARQSRPLYSPRLIVELNDVHNWVPRDFDGRTGSPIRVTPAQEVMDHESSDVDEEGVEVKETDLGDSETGGFGQSRRSANVCFVSSAPKDSTTNKNVNDFGDLLEDEKKAPPTDGGFGRSRYNSRPVGPIARPFVDNEHSMEHECSKAFRGEEAKENDVTPPPSFNTTIGSFGGSRRGARPRQQLPRSSPNPSSRPYSRQWGGGTERRSSPISSRHNGTFLEQCNKRSGGIEKKNLSGVVVAKSTSNNRDRNGIIIYSPVFPDGEISVLASLCGDLPVGSWVKFNAHIIGGKINTTDFEVEEVPPFETQALGNTVKIKLNAYVPRRWIPGMSTFVPIVETDFVTKVVDSKGLFDETCANQQLMVWIERTIEKSRYNIFWHVDRIDD